MRDSGAAVPVPDESPAERALPLRILVVKLLLLLAWLGVSFVPAFFASDLDRLVWGWPLHYWIGAQGSVIGFLVIIAVDAAVMNRWERGEQPHGLPD